MIEDSEEAEELRWFVLPYEATKLISGKNEANVKKMMERKPSRKLARGSKFTYLRT